MTVHSRILKKNIFTSSALPENSIISESYGLVTHQNLSKIEVFHTKNKDEDESFGLKHHSYEHVEHIMTKFLNKAPEGTNAIVGFRVTNNVFHDTDGLFMLLNYSGTAVKLKNK